MGNEKESSSSSSLPLTPKNEPRTIPKKVASTQNTKMGVWLGLFFHPTRSLYYIRIRQERKSLNATENQACPEEKKEKSKKQQTIPPDDVSSTGEKKMGDSEAGRKKS